MNKNVYIYVGTVECFKNGIWLYDGCISSKDTLVNETIAYSASSAERNITYKYVTKKKQMDAKCVHFYRLSSNPKIKLEPKTIHSCKPKELQNACSKFQQLSIYDI